MGPCPQRARGNREGPWEEHRDPWPGGQSLLLTGCCSGDQEQSLTASGKDEMRRVMGASSTRPQRQLLSHPQKSGEVGSYFTIKKNRPRVWSRRRLSLRSLHFSPTRFCTPLIPILGSQRQVDLWEFKASLVYTISYRTARSVTRVSPVLENDNPPQKGLHFLIV